MDENNTLPTLRGIFVYNKNCIICKNALVANVPKFEDDALNTKCGSGSYTAKTADKNAQREPGRKRLEQVISTMQVLCFNK